MKFKYLGDGEKTIYGLTFSGKAVEVEDEGLCARLSINSDFSIVAEGAEVIPAKKKKKVSKKK